MNRNSIFSTSLVLFCMCFLFGNCYFNPLVNGILNPVEEKDDPMGMMALGIAGAFSNVPSQYVVTGQILSNGMPDDGLTLNVISRSSEPKNLPQSAFTDLGGRFYLLTSLGMTDISVVQTEGGEEVYRFSLEIGIGSVHLTELTTGTNYTVTALELQIPGNTIEYFDLVSSYPSNNMTMPFPPESMTLIFSESLTSELLGMNEEGLLSWWNNNIIITPSIYVTTVMINSEEGQPPKDISGYWSTQSIQNSIDYTITLFPGIRSATGKVLKTKTIRFRVEPES
ncbi:hypothetical protein [Leptospira brenneri]|uniref:Carboxypeptidase regulatory-like domain-containing protein n=1 Tax=Leptospira brenneri TaxID=2023182 RepID=A0A2M9Y6Z4_9LEPT|nr:hypothetical protein [Leptospira brenneri]PJZ47327.1 hypothetical protein CH361_03080 [Leptospira brenneri]TGK95708.1 hypothetical protein EHQ30_03465 [Leptospira brenneri]